MAVTVITLCEKSCNSRVHGGLEEQLGMSENLFLNISGKCLQGAVVRAETGVGVDQADKVMKWHSMREEVTCVKSQI